MNKIILITGASSGFGRLTANALADAGHTVYASMRETKGRNAPQFADVEKYAKDRGVDLNAIELDVGSQDSVDAAVADISEADAAILNIFVLEGEAGAERHLRADDAVPAVEAMVDAEHVHRPALALGNAGFAAG